MSKSAKAKVDELLARESHHLREQKIHNLCSAIKVQLYRAEKVTTSNQRQFRLRMNRDQQAAAIWSDADRQRAIKQLERETHQVTPAKRRLSVHYSNIMNDNQCRKSGPRQPIPEAYSLKTCSNEDCCG